MKLTRHERLDTPPDWTLAPIREVAPLQRGFDLPASQLHPGSYPVVYSNGIAQHHNRPIVKGPGVVTGRSGTIGRVHFIETDYWPHNTTLWVTSFCNNHPKFIYYLYTYTRLAQFLAGSGVPTLNRNDVHSHLVQVPPLPEQRAIAEALSDVDDLLHALEALVAKKQATKRAAMQRLLTGKTRLPGFRSGWNRTILMRVGSVYGGLSGKTKTDFGKGNARYVTFLGVLNNVRIDARHTDQVRVATHETQNVVQQGDLLFNGTSETPGDLAMGAVVGAQIENLYLNSFCFGFRVHNKNRHVPLFLAYFFRGSAGRRLMNKLSQGATRYNISKKQFLALSLIIPDYEEQLAIAGVLSDMDAEIAALQRRVEKTRAVKQGMMQQLLTGRVRLVECQVTATP